MSEAVDKSLVLRRFNEKVAKLNGLSFIRDAEQIGAILEWKKDAGWDGVCIGPDEEATDAAMLTLRFFLQDNESTSLRNVAGMYPTLGVAQDLEAEFLRVRAQLNLYLDSPSNLAISDDRNLSHGDILQIFLWGGLAHANRVHEQTYLAIRDGDFFPLFRAEFLSTVRAFLRALGAMSAVNAKALEELGG